MKSKKKVNRVVYRLWHDLSEKGRVGYIGKDKYHPSRWNLKSRSKQKNSKKLFLALQKYPIKVWNKDILASGFRSDKTLIKAEIYWIKKFDSKNKGYNCTDGGEGTSGLIISDETRAKFSKLRMGNQNLKGHKFSAEWRANISKAGKGKQNFLGRHHTEETKKS
jgi:group I intron endonuclease